MGKISEKEVMPNFDVDTAYETGVSLKSLLGEKTVIWVLRYIGCTVCHYDVQVACDRYKEITEKGAKIIFVMQSDQAHIREAYPEESLPFDIICDPKMNIYKQLEIKPADSMEALVGTNMDALVAKGGKAEAMGFSHGDYEGNEQQLPAMFIVNKNLEVLYAKYADNIVDLPDFDGVLKLL